MMIKPNAHILDATAANRKFWRVKEDKRIMWIDIQPDLDITPDLIIDCTKTDFPDQSFHTIIFDPPHWWGDAPASTFYTCKNERERAKFVEKYGSGGYAYYGTDVYKTKSQLLKFLHNAQNELYRILWDNGVLWFNWSDVKIPLNNIISMFTNWDEMIRLDIGSKRQTMGTAQNYWVMLMKKDRPIFQTNLGTSIDKQTKRIKP